MERILVVNDEPELVEACASILESGGYEALATTEGAKAASIAVEFQPDLILLDLILDRIEGEKVMSELRASPVAQVPVVVMSALVDGLDRARKMGAAAFLPKPFDYDTLLRVIGETLHHSEAASAQTANRAGEGVGSLEGTASSPERSHRTGTSSHSC